MSLQRIFNDGFNTRNPDLTNVTNPGETKKIQTPAEAQGDHPYATPFHEKLAVGLLVGCVALLFICFGTLPFLFPPNYNETWEHDVKAKTHHFKNGTVTSLTHLLQ